MGPGAHYLGYNLIQQCLYWVRADCRRGRMTWDQASAPLQAQAKLLHESLVRSKHHACTKLIRSIGRDRVAQLENLRFCDGVTTA